MNTCKKCLQSLPPDCFYASSKTRCIACSTGARMKTVTVVLALLLAGCASTPLPEKYRRKNPNPITIELRQRTICQEERDGRTIVYTCEVPE